MIFTAEVTGFLRTIFVLILIYYVLKFASKYILPILLKNFIQKAQEQQRNAQGGPRSNTKEGETVVDKAPKTKKTDNNQVGEYVDFEEIE
jgi:bacteriorhodopsin